MYLLRANLIPRALFFLFLFGCIVITFSVISNTDSLGYYQDGSFFLQDFHFANYTLELLWNGEIKSPYSLESNSYVLSKIAEGHMAPSFPFLLTPAAIPWWIPFHLLNGVSFNISYYFLVLFSCTSIFFSLVYASAKISERSILFLAGATTLLSEQSYSCLALGQYSLVTLSALFLLILTLQDKNRSHLWIYSLCFAFLAIKPTFFYLGIFIFLIFRSFVELTKSLLIALLFCLAGTLVVGIDWPILYLKLLGFYLSNPSDYLTGIAFDGMTNLRGILSPYLSLDRIQIATRILFVIFTAFGLYGAFFVEEFEKRASFLVFPYGAILLFSPYLGRYDDLLLGSLVFSPFFFSGYRRFWAHLAVLFFVLSLNSLLIFSNDEIFRFSLKVLCLFSVWKSLRMPSLSISNPT